MENYKKEKSSKQHMKIDIGADHEQDDIFMLANPMTYGGGTPSPLSPRGYSISTRSSTTVSNPNTPTNNSSGGFARTFERLSLKDRAKKIFSRGGHGASVSGNGGGSNSNSSGVEGGAQPRSQSTSNGTGSHVTMTSSGGSRGNTRKMTSMEDEDYGVDASSGSDHEDPFSPNSLSAGDLINIHRQTSEPPKSPSSSVEHLATLPRTGKRHHSSAHSCRDSGFSSERESISQLKEDFVNQTYHITDDVGVVSPAILQDTPAGMEALEVLHNQLQLLVRKDSDEDTDSVEVYELTIAKLIQQIEEHSVAMEALRESESNLRLSLRQSEQVALDAQTKLLHVEERCLRAERKCDKLTTKYKSLRKKQQEMERSHQKYHQLERMASLTKVNCQQSPRASLIQQNSNGSVHLSHSHSPSQQSSPPSASSRVPPQRVQSQTIYDRQNKTGDNSRPSTAQGFHRENNSRVSSSRVSIASLSHTETSV